MADTPNNAATSALMYDLNATVLRVQHLIAGIPAARLTRWLLFGQDARTGAEFYRGAAGAVVTLGLPWLSAQCSLRWLGSRLFYWPQGIPARHRVAIVSSRLRQRLDEESWWFDLLRTAVLRTDPTTDVLCAVAGTASHRFVRRAADLFGRSLLDFRVDPREQSVGDDEIAEWLMTSAGGINLDPASAIAEADLVAEPPITENYTRGKYWPVCVSPPIAIPSVLSDSDESAASTLALFSQPIADRILFAVSDRLQVLRARPAGVIYSLLNLHVQDAERRKSLLMIASDSTGQLPSISSEPTGCVVPWLLKSRIREPELPINRKRATTSDTDLRTIEVPVSFDSPLSQPDDWLLHWTRSTVGPWPDQDVQEFDDELILGCQSSDRSSLATLLRIVTEGRLWASSETIRGGIRVVSFTEVPLHEFRSRRTYRRHRRRYDFEPWGIAIRRDILAAAGARAVEYGDEETWETLPDAERPFFQNIGAGDGWTKDEREWRITDHVHLHELPVSAVAVFVDSAAAREILQMETQWQVLVVPKTSITH